MDDDKQMTIDDFKQQLLADVDRFVKSWKTGMENDPSSYEESMAVDEWHEQHAAFLMG